MMILPKDERIELSKKLTGFSKLAAAEACIKMLKDKEDLVRINALKAIRHHALDNFEKDIIAMLTAPSEQVRISAIKTLASFGKNEHFALVKTYYEENEPAKEAIIESFVNYSDFYPAYEFMLSQLESKSQKIQKACIDWFSKAFKRDILVPWIVESYKNSPFKIKRLFERKFYKHLPKLFFDKVYGYRFKLAFLVELGEKK